MRPLRLLFLVFIWHCPSIAQNELHPWYESNDLGIAFNEDQSEVLIVAYDMATLWNTADGTLIQSMKMPQVEDKIITKDNFKFIDAAPDLSEFIYKVNNSYQRFMLDIEDRDLFPDFQNRRVKEIMGYDAEGWIVFFSEGFYQGFYRVKQQGNTSFVEFLSLEYISKATVSNDHKYIYFSRDQTFRYLNINTKKVTDTKLPVSSWRDQHLPPGMVTLYEWNNSKKDGKKVQWRYFINTKNGTESKKIKGKSAQRYFPDDTHCKGAPFYTYGATKDHVWILYYYEKDLDRAKAAYEYTLHKVNRKDCKVLQTIDFSEPAEANAARKQKKRDDYFAKRKEDNAKKEALNANYFSDYITKFVPLPSTYILNYKTMKGVDVTNQAYVQNEKYRMGNPKEFAVGRLVKCTNGNRIVLRVTRTNQHGMDTQSFRVFTYDSNGKQIGHQRIAQTQKYQGNFPQLSYFTLTTANEQWTANVKIKYLTTGKERTESYSGGCN